MNLHANVVTVTHQVSSSVTFTNPLFSAVFFIFYIVFSLMIISDPQKSPFCFWVKNTQRLPSVLLATLFMTKALLLFYYVEVYKKLNKKDPTQTHKQACPYSPRKDFHLIKYFKKGVVPRKCSTTLRAPPTRCSHDKHKICTNAKTWSQAGRLEWLDCSSNPESL